MKLLAASLFFGFALILGGLMVAMAFEGFEILLERPTISQITHDAAAGHPTYTAISCFVAGGTIIGLLVHFVGWRA